MWNFFLFIKEYVSTHRRAAWGLQIAMIVLVFIGVQSWQTRNLPESGSKAPALEGTFLNGNADTDWLRNSKGNRVIYFFAPWCKVCDFSIGNFFSLAAENQSVYDQNNQLLAVALAYTDKDEVLDFLDNRAGKVPVLLAPESVAREWKIPGFPTVAYINTDGSIITRNIGYSSWLGLRWMIWKEKVKTLFN